MTEAESPSQSFEQMLKNIESLEAIIETWDEDQQRTVVALKTAIAALNKEAFARLIRNVKCEPAAMSSLKQALADEVVYSVLRHHKLLKPSLHERIEEALATVRPALASHGGSVELVEVQLPSTAVVRLIGACSHCPASELTLSEGVEKAIKEHCPEIVEVRRVMGLSNCSTIEIPVNFVSPFAALDDSNWTHALKLSQLQSGVIKALELNGYSLILTLLGDKVVCYQNSCAHLGMPIDMGNFENGIITCPYHGFKFAIDSGECLTAPEVQLESLAVRFKEDSVEIKL
jgi:Fe-S cluster biogenesis protein NfuA/nitrite reductase/ring-hydroxylating ferredoxin subunit